MHPIGRKERGYRARRFNQKAAPIHPILLWLAEAAHESRSIETSVAEPAATVGAVTAPRHYCG